MKEKLFIKQLRLLKPAPQDRPVTSPGKGSEANGQVAQNAKYRNRGKLDIFFLLYFYLPTEIQEMFNSVTKTLNNG